MCTLSRLLYLIISISNKGARYVLSRYGEGKQEDYKSTCKDCIFLCWFHFALNNGLHSCYKTLWIDGSSSKFLTLGGGNSAHTFIDLHMCCTHTYLWEMREGSEVVANLKTGRFLSGFFCCSFCSCKTTRADIRTDTGNMWEVISLSKLTGGKISAICPNYSNYLMFWILIVGFVFWFVLVRSVLSVLSLLFKYCKNEGDYQI